MEAAGAVSVSVFSKTIKVNASSARPSMQIAGLHCIVTFNWVKDYQMISNGTSSKRVENAVKKELEKISTFREKVAICV